MGANVADVLCPSLWAPTETERCHQDDLSNRWAMWEWMPTLSPLLSVSPIFLEFYLNTIHQHGWGLQKNNTCHFVLKGRLVVISLDNTQQLWKKCRTQVSFQDSQTKSEVHQHLCGSCRHQALERQTKPAMKALCTFPKEWVKSCNMKPIDAAWKLFPSKEPPGPPSTCWLRVNMWNDTATLAHERDAFRVPCHWRLSMSGLGTQSFIIHRKQRIYIYVNLKGIPF